MGAIVAAVLGGLTRNAGERTFRCRVCFALFNRNPLSFVRRFTYRGRNVDLQARSRVEALGQNRGAAARESAPKEANTVLPVSKVMATVLGISEA